MKLLVIKCMLQEVKMTPKRTINGNNFLWVFEVDTLTLIRCITLEKLGVTKLVEENKQN